VFWIRRRPEDRPVDSRGFTRCTCGAHPERNSASRICDHGSSSKTHVPINNKEVELRSCQAPGEGGKDYHKT
jgi:hypothetical protein